MTPSTDEILLGSMEALRTEVGNLSAQVADLRVHAARDEGLDRGLALAKRVETVETELSDRPTTRQIGEMFDNRIRRLTTRLIAGAFAGIPVWMGAGVALAALLSR